MPKNCNYFWSFGALAMITLVTMIVSGIFLAMNYTPHTDMAFDSVERIMRDVNYGWLLRYIHLNGAAFFFIIVYIHIIRGMYYGSYKYPRELNWILRLCNICFNDGNCFSWLYSSLGSNVLLGSNSYYKFI